jgi:hypothetical protein
MFLRRANAKEKPAIWRVFRAAFCFNGDYHLSIGHFSVAMRNFACVLHPHFLHLPVPANPEPSQNSQPLQISTRE